MVLWVRVWGGGATVQEALVRIIIRHQILVIIQYI